MAEMTIAMRGASAAEQQLQKVAGGYRAIGGAAQQAAHQAAKVHGGGHGGGIFTHQTAGITRVLGGRGSPFAHLAHLGSMGPMGVAAMGGYAAKEIGEKVLEELKEERKREVEAIIDTRKEFLHFGEAMKEVTNGLQKDAVARFQAMGPQGQAQLLAKGGPEAEAIKKAQAAHKELEMLGKTRFASELSDATDRQLEEARHPYRSAALKRLAPMFNEVQDQRTRMESESGRGYMTRHLEGLFRLNNHPEATKFGEVVERFQEAVSRQLEIADKNDALINRGIARVPSP